MRNAERIALIGEALMLATALNFGIDQGAISVDAATNTPTPTVTPDALQSARATLAAVQRENERNKELTATRQQIDALRGTPAPTRVPSPTLTLAPDVLVIDRRELNQLIDKGVEIGVNARLTVIAVEQSARRTPIPSPVVRAAEKQQDGGPPGILWAGITAVAGFAGSLLAIRERTRIGPLIRRVPGGGRILTFIKRAINLND